MRFGLSVFLSLSFSLLLFSCDDSENANSNTEKAFFDVKGFVENQIVILNAQKPQVTKNLKMGEEENNVITKDVDWKKELELFVQSDINKPAYKQSYSTLKNDSLYIEYVLKSDQDLSVRNLKIEFGKISGQPIRITARLVSENKLYQSEKNIELRCIEKDNSSLVSYYKITGFQKLATMDKKPFFIEGKVIN